MPNVSILFSRFGSLLPLIACTALTSLPIHASERPTRADNVVLQWDEAALQAIRDTHPGPPMAARALAITHTCIYDAWAAYAAHAIGTRYGGLLRRPVYERSLANRSEAVSYAAYRSLIDLYPSEQATVLDPLMVALGYDPKNASTDTTTPAGIGNVACAAVLTYRHSDGSNQLGDLHPGAYSDWTGYSPVNPASTAPIDYTKVVDPNRWQPLIYDDGLAAPAAHVITQKFVGAQWYTVAPFSLTSANQFSGVAATFGPALYGSPEYRDQALALIAISANLTDKQKLIAEYWANGPKTELPPGHWCLFAQFVSRRDHHSLNQDAKMFFAMTNAIFDASIASWSAKQVFDYVRPITAIPYLFHGQQIQSWVPLKGTQSIDGSQWSPYQKPTFPTPPFPEFISGHSTFSAAGAEVLRRFTGSDNFGDSVTFAAGGSTTEPGLVPAQDVTLYWGTFSDAADEAGISRRYGGIHFEAGDLSGRAVGRLVGAQAWTKALTYFKTRADDFRDE